MTFAVHVEDHRTSHAVEVAVRSLLRGPFGMCQAAVGTNRIPRPVICPACDTAAPDDLSDQTED